MQRIIPAIIFLTIAAITLSHVLQHGPVKSWLSSNKTNVESSVLEPNQVNVEEIKTAAATSFPTLTGRVVDNANLLTSAQKTALTQTLEAFESKSSDQIVVTTIVTLNGENLEDYSNRLFRKWQLGQADENNGVLLLISKNDRKIRIEVGYGLEGVLTDALSKLIIETKIVPAFKAGNFGEGILEGANSIISVLSGDGAELEARERRHRENYNEGVQWSFWIFMTIWVILFFGPFGFALLASIFGKKLGKGRYRWLGIDINTRSSGRSSSGGGWSSGGSSGGGFSGGGGSSGGGGASGGW